MYINIYIYIVDTVATATVMIFPQFVKNRRQKSKTPWLVDAVVWHVQVQKNYHTPTLVSYKTKQQTLSSLPFSTQNNSYYHHPIPFHVSYRVVQGTSRTVPRSCFWSNGSLKAKTCQVNRDGARFMKPQSCWTLTSFYENPDLYYLEATSTGYGLYAVWCHDFEIVFIYSIKWYVNIIYTLGWFVLGKA